jgi:hypothetical protein
MFQLLFAAVFWFLQLIHSVLVPLCLVTAWGITILLVWSMWAALRDGVASARQMHQIPCAHCRYFTKDYRLKCPVQPTIALSEAAIRCGDYEPLPTLNSLSHNQ